MREVNMTPRSGVRKVVSKRSFRPHLYIERILQQYQSRPSGIAVIDEHNQPITYQTLVSNALLLSHELKNRGVKQNDRVVILLPRSGKALISIVAIALCGATYVPIDPECPEDRIKYILSDCVPSAVLSLTEVCEPFRQLEYVFISMDSLQETPLNLQSEQLDFDKLCATSVAYIIYTSGSTGKPKGVKVGHANLNYYLDWLNDDYVLDHSGVFDFSSPLSFDLSITCTLFPLTIGATVSVCPQSIKIEPLQYLEYLEKNHINFIKVTPAFFNKLERFAAAWAGDLSKIKYILLGGEACSKKDICTWLSTFPLHSIVNEYGPTEATVAATSYFIDRVNVRDLSEPVPIGIPAPGAVIYLCGSDRSIINDADTVGEIYIGGDGVALGYLNNEALTQERFVSSKALSADIPEQILYRTGDRAFWNSSGALVYVGRDEDYVKVRGYRVDLTEVDMAIKSISGVSSSVTITHDNTLYSFIKFHGDISGKQTVSPGEIGLDKLLPEYFLPSKIVVVQSYPLTANGKVDKAYLIGLVTHASHNQSSTIKSAYTSLEKQFALICARILKNDIDLEKSFIDCGGHSLLAMEVAYEVWEHLSLNCSVADILTSHSLKIALQRAEAVDKRRYLGKARPSGCSYYPLSNQQWGVWVAEQMGVTNNYNVVTVHRLSSDVQVNKLHNCICSAINAHDIYKIRTISSQGAAHLTVDGEANTKLNVAIIKEKSKACEEVLDEVLLNEQHYIFDLNNEAPVRVTIVVAHDAVALVFALHHLVSDEWSLGLLLRQIEGIYNGTSQGVTCGRSFDYFDYIHWQKDESFAVIKRAQLSFWRRLLEQQDADISWSGYGGDARFAGKTGVVPVSFGDNLSRKLGAYCSRNSVTPFVWALTVFSIAVSHFSGDQQFRIGVPFANRVRQEFSGTLGFFSNTLPLPCDFREKGTFRHYMKGFFDLVNQVFLNQEVTYGDIVGQAEKRVSSNLDELFQVMFVYRDEQRSILNLDGVSESEYIEPAAPYTKSPLTLFVFNRAGHISCRFEYDQGMFDSSSMWSLAGMFQQLADQSLENDQRNIAEMSLVQPFPCQLKTIYQGQCLPKKINDGVIPLFHESVQTYSKNIAISQGAEVVTYRELDFLSNQVANWLEAHGANPGDVIGIGLERSMAQVITILAVLKMGGTYCPVDLSLPKERLQYILSNSEMSFMVNALGAVESFDGMVACLEYDCNDIEKYPLERTLVESQAPAYIMYTSGSTGLPKGVLIPQAGIVRLACDKSYYKLGAEDKLGYCANPCFDASTFEIWTGLLNGASVVMPTKQESENLGSLCRFFEKNELTALWLTKALFDEIVNFYQVDFSKIRYLVIGGEALNPHTVNKVLNSNKPPEKILNGYGPTENTTFTCMYEIQKSDVVDSVSLPIGGPVANTEIAIVNGYGQPVPWGVVGELWVSGDGLASGYLNDRSRTDEKFVYSSNLDAIFGKRRWYKTGDYVRLDVEGRLKFIGRVDGQVKLRGFRIETHEIESCLCEHKEVAQAQVLIHSEQLVAVLVPVTSTCVDRLQDSVRANVANKLPHYMCPDRYLVLDTLPKTPNGKLDRAALLSNIHQQQAVAKGTLIDTKIQPKAGILATIWESILGVRPKVLEDDFFMLGGSSLKLLNLAYQLSEAFGMKVGIALLAENTLFGQQYDCLNQLMLDECQEDILTIAECPQTMPLYLVHPSSGQSLGYRGLAPYLDRTVYALNDPFFLDEEHVYSSFEEMARVYADIIMRHTVHKEIQVGGWSFGGALAIEIARCLKANGIGVKGVVLIDTFGAYNKNCYQKIRDVLMTELNGEQFFQRRCELVEELQNLQFIVNAKIPFYDGRVTLLKAADRTEHLSSTLVNFDDVRGGWSESVLPYLTVVPIPGNHHTIIEEPNVTTLAKELNKLDVSSNLKGE